MLEVTVRKVGGSVMVTLPQAALDQLEIAPGSRMQMIITDRQISLRRARPTRAEMLAQCDFSLPITPEDKAWMTSSPVGDEAI